MFKKAPKKLSPQKSKETPPTARLLTATEWKRLMMKKRHLH